VARHQQRLDAILRVHRALPRAQRSLTG
jgi:hypothetical protein